MSDFTTHLAAIGVGVAITLLLVGGFNNATAKKADDSTSSSKSAPSASKAKASTAGAAATGGAGKKKNKKKSKKKANAAPAPAAVVAPVVVAPVVTPEPVKVEEAPKAAPAPAPAVSEGKKKKNKKNKKAAAANGSSNGNGNSTAAAAATPAPAPAPKAAPVAAPAPVAAASASFVVPLQARIVEEEAWATIPTKKKNKNTGFKKAQAAAAAAASSGAATAAPDPKASDRVTIDASRIGIIIGPKGATMNAIQEKTGVKLDVNAPKLEEGTSSGGGSQFRPVVGGRKSTQTATVVITDGTSESRQVAKKAILELAARGYATLLQAEGFGESSVEVHPRFLSEIVGTGGKIIKAIQSNLDVKLTIPKTEWTPKTMQIGHVPPSVRVGIAGDSPQNVKTAKQVIRDLCLWHHHEITHPGFTHQEVYVPQEFFHCVIGTRGSEIKHIRGNYHVDVYMPSADSVSESVVCVGRPNDVEKAISYIKLLMDRDSELREQKYSDEGFGDDSHGW